MNGNDEFAPGGNRRCRVFIADADHGHGGFLDVLQKGALPAVRRLPTRNISAGLRDSSRLGQLLTRIAGGADHNPAFDRRHGAIVRESDCRDIFEIKGLYGADANVDLSKFQFLTARLQRQMETLRLRRGFHEFRCRSTSSVPTGSSRARRNWDAMNSAAISRPFKGVPRPSSASEKETTDCRAGSRRRCDRSPPARASRPH